MKPSRRTFCKISGLAAACWMLPQTRMALAQKSAGTAQPCFEHTHPLLAPNIARFVDQIAPGKDEFLTEKYAYEIAGQIDEWAAGLGQSTKDISPLDSFLSSNFSGAPLTPSNMQMLRNDGAICSWAVSFSSEASCNRRAFLAEMQSYLAGFQTLDVIGFEIDRLKIQSKTPLRLEIQLHYNLAGNSAEAKRQQRCGEWSMEWVQHSEGRWELQRWTAGRESRVELAGPGFVDISEAALGTTDSYHQQLAYGQDHWRGRLDGASGIDIYGNNGLAVGDFDGDGFDDIYVCQPAGLPNRLYKNNGDGSFTDYTDAAGVGILDATSSALFVDFNNNGLQDLLVVRSSGPILFVNQGNGRFAIKHDAFHFKQPLQGSFTGVSVADYNRDGLLDIYLCTYSFYQGLSDYEFPNPYYDAQNGPPNFLLKNLGNHEFEDVTEAAGLNHNNNRFSFAALWADYDHDGWPDLYVVNDFGRKILYHNNGDGSFTDRSKELGVEDQGEGMSMTWFDADNDGEEEMYLVNMWESAGRRITDQPEFMPSAPAEIRQALGRDALGNSFLKRNAKNGGYEEQSESSGTRFGGWNWGSDAWDFDHDGFNDLYIANGFISGEDHSDLSSFYWRHIAAHAIENGGHNPHYADAWSAINEFIRSGYTWSGYQRNNFYLNNRNGSFSEIASLLGLDCMEDGRAFVLSDLDHDGSLEVILKNRTAPQVRIFANRMKQRGNAILFRLKGRSANADAIGAEVILTGSFGKQMRYLRAGSGFLSQNSRELHFGIGTAESVEMATILWPDGSKQIFKELPANHRIEITQGASRFQATPFSASGAKIQGPAARTAAFQEKNEDGAIWMLEPVTLPDPVLTTPQQKRVRLSEIRGSIQVLLFTDLSCESMTQGEGATESRQRSLARLGIDAILINTATGDWPQSPVNPHTLTADAQATAIYAIFRRYLLDKRVENPMPSAWLLNPQGELVALYNTLPAASIIARDLEALPRDDQERRARALPFHGFYLHPELHHNYFAYGVAYLQHDFLDEARAAFELSLRFHANNPAANYNLGVIHLNQQHAELAQKYLERTVDLDPANVDAWNNLGVLAGQAGNLEAAEHYFSQTLARQPAHLLALQNQVRLLRHQARTDEAKKLLARAIHANPLLAEPHRGLALLLLQEKNLPEAKEEFQRAVELEPQNAEFLNGLGTVLMQSGEREKAIAIFEKARAMDPAFDRPCLNLAVLYVARGDVTKAYNMLSNFLQQHPENKLIQDALNEVNKRR